MSARAGGRRTGYSTGTWAAAAAKGAAMALFLGERPEAVDVRLPCGDTARLPLGRIVVRSRAATCRVVKEGAEKGDVTSGAEMVATVIASPGVGVRVKGGRGTGKVTKPGLELPVGERAINPVPRAMIREEVEEVLERSGAGEGCLVVISVPEGERIARRTLNSRLGVVGGISILGTSGLVIPYSTDAFLVALEKSMDVARACGNRSLALCTGRRSEAAARRNLRLREECFVVCGDRLHFALHYSLPLGFSWISVWTMPGKMAKLADGRFDLHSKRGLPNARFMASLLGMESASPARIEEADAFRSAHAFLDSLDDDSRRTLYRCLCLSAALNCWRFLEGRCAVQCNLLDREGDLVASACCLVPEPYEREANVAF